MIESFLVGAALGGLVGLTGYYAAKVPALKTVGTRPDIWGLSVKYAGLNTYRLVGQEIFKSTLRTTVRYEYIYIKELYSGKLPWQVQ